MQNSPSQQNNSEFMKEMEKTWEHHQLGMNAIHSMVFRDVEINELEEGKLYYYVEYMKFGSDYEIIRKKLGIFLKKDKDSNELQFEEIVNFFPETEQWDFKVLPNTRFLYYTINEEVLNFILKFMDSQNDFFEDEVHIQTNCYGMKRWPSGSLLILETFKSHIYGHFRDERNMLFQREEYLIEFLKRVNEYVLKKNLKKLYINTFEFLINCEFNNNNIIKNQQKNSIGTNLKEYIASYF